MEYGRAMEINQVKLNSFHKHDVKEAEYTKIYIFHNSIYMKVNNSI